MSKRKNPSQAPKYSITLAESDSDEEDDVPSKLPGRQLTSLQQAHVDKLSGSRFRVLNEELYTTTSEESWERFQADPSLFNNYHAGFREQAKTWQEGSGNPVHWILEAIRFGSGRGSGGKVEVADFGCGDALIARTLCPGLGGDEGGEGGKKKKKKKKKKRKKEEGGDGGISAAPTYVVHSLDLVSPAPPSPLSSIIRACNISSVPFLPTQSVDVNVYSLALMGTDVFDILKEGSRVLKVGGRLLIAEVRSRFGTGSESLLPRFTSMLEVLGFRLVNGDKRRKNKFFIFMELVKEREWEKVRKFKEADVGGEGQFLKPCIYKRR